MRSAVNRDDYFSASLHELHTVDAGPAPTVSQKLD